ncbi:MAG: glycosyltransferase, partial [Lachnospiraceae bacterium]
MGQEAPIRILQILNHMDYGGIEAVVMNYYRHIDRTKIQFDFAVSRDSVLPQRKEIKKLGGNIYLLPPISHVTGYHRVVKKLIQSHGYDIIHCHMNTLSVFPLFAAYRAGAKVRICHNHTTAHRGEGAKTILKYLLRPMNRWFATDYFACGEYAGKWMYGKKAMQTGRVYIMRNAIDVEKFRYNTITRISMRMKMELADKFVVGHIGRFMYQKNHEFLIDVFSEVHRRNEDAVLLLVGEGELEGHIKKKVKRLGLEKNVIFYGTSEDTSKLYQVMDVFCLPSFYEG